MSSIMRIKSFIIIYCLIIGCLLLNHSFGIDAPFVIRPKIGQDICTIGKSDCSLDDVQYYVVYTHNVERLKITKGSMKMKMPIATNMLYMEWDADLEKKAQKYAETCLQKPGPQHCPPPGENENDGEVNISVQEYPNNIEKLARSRAASVIMNWTSAAKKFTENRRVQLVKSYNLAPNETSFYNFAKYINTHVWKIGCGIADFPGSAPNKFKEVFVCFYGPPKLIQGQELYRPGCVPCSHCPIGSSCYENKQSIFKNALCEVTSDSFPVFKKHKLSEEEICFTPQELAPKTTTKKPFDVTLPNKDLGKENIVWEGIIRNGTQECKGDHTCHPGWNYSDEYAHLTVKRKCTSSAVFREKIYINESSCFKFLYMKKTANNALTNEIIAFAFEVSSQGKGLLKKVKHEDSSNYQDIFLDIPWTGVYIYVGLGTQSKSDNSYEIQAKNFTILSGKCPHT